MAWLPGLQTGRGEPMSVISDTDVRGDLILKKIKQLQLFTRAKHEQLANRNYHEH